MQYQITIATDITYKGIGLHSGTEVIITLKSAPPNTGIVFIRVDLPGQPKVKACAKNVTNTMRATTLEKGAAKVFTVEHLLAAFNALNIDNCYVEINSVEPPVADGSALVFAELINTAGIMKQSELRPEIIIDKVYAVHDKDRFITIIPYDGFRITFTSTNPHPLLGIQFADFEVNQEVFMQEIAGARTIGFMHEVEALKAQGLALGGSLENVVVYDEEKVLTPLRFEDELVRHKVLDIIGDFMLAGKIKGHIIAVKSSHALNTELAKKILIGNKGE